MEIKVKYIQILGDKKYGAKLNSWYICFRDFKQLIAKPMEKVCL